MHKLIEHSSERWKLYGDKPESHLLRLAILRDLIRLIHAEKSRLLAKGLKHNVNTLEKWETQIELAKNSANLDCSLEDILEAKSELIKQKHAIPDAFFKHIKREKLERHDRAWEYAITAQALSVGWAISQLEAWVPISSAEKWHHALGDFMFPNGIILFAESAANPQDQKWKGRWLLVTPPNKAHTPPDLNSLPGYCKSPEPPRWTLLFLPNKS
jgi:hypothetical protein